MVDHNLPLSRLLMQGYAPFIIIIIIIIIFFFDPGTQFPRKEKIMLCNIKKSTKIKLE